MTHTLRHAALLLFLAAGAVPAFAQVEPASAVSDVASIIAADPANGDRIELPVHAITFTFSAPVELNSLRLSGPRGKSNVEQVLVADGEKVPLAAVYSYPLKTPMAAVGRYWVDLMAWEGATNTSISQSYAFAIGTTEELATYDVITAQFNAAEELKTPSEPAVEEAPQ